MNRHNLYDCRDFTLKHVFTRIKVAKKRNRAKPTNDDYIACIDKIKDFLITLNVRPVLFLIEVPITDLKSIEFNFIAQSWGSTSIWKNDKFKKSERFELSNKGKRRIIELCKTRGLL